jgi:hypothetical protein
MRFRSYGSRHIGVREGFQGVAVMIAIVGGNDFVGDDSGQLCAALAARGHHVTAYVRQRDRQTAGKSTKQDYRID